MCYLTAQGIIKFIDGIVETHHLTSREGDELALTGWAQHNQQEAEEMQLQKKM